MQTTPYGYLNPDNGDLSKGTNGWMAAWNFNVLRWDGHSHNGIDSALLNISSISSQTATAPSGSWVASLGGTGRPAGGYQQTVTCPAAITEINNYMVKFLISTAGSTQYQPVQLFYARETATTFTVYSNDNAIDLLCVFR
jgi:hypothetical protein